MDNYRVILTVDKGTHHFEIGEYLHPDGEGCKVKVFQEGRFVASFQPDSHNFLHICQNPGNLDEGLLYQLADRIEGLTKI